MTPELRDLHLAYHQCWHAVAWCELMVSANDLDDRDMWQEFREAGIRVEEVVAILVETLNDPDDDLKPHVRQIVLDDMATELFRRYVGGKLGMM
jgi:hypothetical protein